MKIFHYSLVVCLPRDTECRNGLGQVPAGATRIAGPTARNGISCESARQFCALWRWTDSPAFPCWNPRVTDLNAKKRPPNGVTVERNHWAECPVRFESKVTVCIGLD